MPRWDGLYRHMTLAKFALAHLAVLCARLQAPQIQQAQQAQQAQQDLATHGEAVTEIAKRGYISSRST